MKKLLCMIMVVVMMALVLPPVSAQTLTSSEPKQILSEMSEQECISFLKNHNIEIPDDYEDELVWGPFIQSVIASVENDSDCLFSYNYSVTQEFAEAIRNAVNEYYGIKNAGSKSESNTKGTRAFLQDSTMLGAWMDQYRSYNCYAYAIGQYTWREPGFMNANSGFSVSMGIGAMANLVVNDLQSLGYPNATASSSMPNADNLCTNQHLICIRKGTVDFHLMKYNNGNWDHKPGSSQPLRYKYTPDYVRVWTNEGAMYNEPYSGNTTYDSVIYYITYGQGHTNTYTHKYTIMGDTHTLCCATCDKVLGKATPCSYSANSNVCKVCGTPKTLIMNSVGGQVLPLNTEKTLVTKK